MVVMSMCVAPTTPRGRHNEPMHPDEDARSELRDAMEEFKESTEEVVKKRDEAIRRAKAKGLRQKDIVKETEYTRETIRRILNPDAAEAVRRAAAARRQQRKQAE